MAGERVLSQEEIDSVFRNMRDSPQESDPAKRAQPYDFRRPDRIAKDQLRAIHVLHENFARSLASSLSAYLRAYVAVNLVSVEQLSFMEFSQCLPSPSCLVSLAMKPFEGNAVMEVNNTLVFPILEMLLGGSGKFTTKLNREITEIEQSILDGLFRIILHDLKLSWQAVANLDFTIETHETEPQLLQILAPNEAVVAISMEVRIGDNSGMMNHRHPLDHHQDAAPEVRPAMVGAQERVHAGGARAHPAADQARRDPGGCAAAGPYVDCFGTCWRFRTAISSPSIFRWAGRSIC